MKTIRRQMCGLLGLAAVLCGAGCGGGGGGAATSSALNLPAVAAPILAPAAQKLVLQAGLTTLQLAATANAQFYFSNTGQLARLRKPNARSASFFGDGSCQSGFSTLITYSGATTVTDSITYFDVQCKQKQIETVDYLTYGPSTYNDIETVTTYDGAANVLEYDGRTYAGSGNAFTSTVAFATKSGQPPYRSESVTCTFTTASMSCGSAEAMNVNSLGQSIGAIATLSAALSPSGPSAGIAYSIGVSTYSGGLFGLVLNPLTSLPYTFQGVTPRESASATGTIGANGPSVPLVVDASSDANLAFTVNGGSYSGVLTQKSTGRLLASVAVASSGSGNIVYSDGSQAPVVTWMINK